MEETIFTKIAKREIPSYIIDETDEFMAILDIFPAVYAQTLVIPKEWKDSYLFKNDDEFIARFMKYVKRIGNLLDEKLGTERCVLMFEGFDVNHLHAKLYPVHGAKELNHHNKGELSKETAEEILTKINS